MRPIPTGVRQEKFYGCASFLQMHPVSESAGAYPDSVKYTYGFLNQNTHEKPEV